MNVLAAEYILRTPSSIIRKSQHGACVRQRLRSFREVWCTAVHQMRERQQLLTFQDWLTWELEMSCSPPPLKPFPYGGSSNWTRANRRQAEVLISWMSKSGWPELANDAFYLACSAVLVWLTQLVWALHPWVYPCISFPSTYICTAAHLIPSWLHVCVTAQLRCTLSEMSERKFRLTAFQYVSE